MLGIIDFIHPCYLSGGRGSCVWCVCVCVYVCVSVLRSTLFLFVIIHI